VVRNFGRRVVTLFIAASLPAAAGIAAVDQTLRAGIRASRVTTVDPRLIEQNAVDTESGFDTPPMPLPADLPVPAAFAWRTPESPQVIVQQFVPAPEAVTVNRTFLALPDDNTLSPPDTSGAAGPSHLIVALNTQLRFQTRSGVVLLTTTVKSFFEKLRNGGRVFDPHVAYDVRTNRWLMCATSDQRTSSSAQPTGSALLLAVSQTGDPLGTWNLYRYNAPTESPAIWFDFPQLGFNDSSINISLNVYGVSDDKFVRVTIYQISRADPTSATFIDYANNGGGFSPVVSQDGGSASYVVQRWNGNSSGNGYLRLYTLSSAGITPVAFVSTPNPWTGTGASGDDFVSQAGTSQKIAAGDDRILSPVLRNGSIWAVHSVFLPLSSPTHAAIQYWQITPSGGLLQRGILEDGSGAFSYTFPSIAVNTRNDVMIAGSRFSATTYPSAFYLFRPAGTPSATNVQPVVFRSGDASYNKIINSSSTSNRWGDYSATCIDPVNGVDFWTIQEYSTVPSGGIDRWGTWWVQLTIGEVSPRHRAIKH
jgi:hypothetical protein